MSAIWFFRAEGGASAGVVTATAQAAAAGAVEVWWPAPTQIRPRGFSLLPFAVWWLFHYAGIFKSGRYQLFFIRSGDKVVHRACVFPAFFRFPFMGTHDVQVGDIWTAESHRGKGLAAATLRQIVRDCPGASVWFLCNAANTASARLAQSAGLSFVGTGQRESRWGLRLFGRFVLDPVPARSE